MMQEYIISIYIYTKYFYFFTTANFSYFVPRVNSLLDSNYTMKNEFEFGKVTYFFYAFCNKHK